jgi:hypothetical protein
MNINPEPTEGWRLQTRKEENDPNKEATKSSLFQLYFRLRKIKE